MADVKIRVEAVERDELDSQKQGQEVKEGAGVEKIAVASIFATQAVNTTKQIVNYAVSNIGNFTGDYIKQDKAQRAVSVVSDMAAVGTAFAVSRVAGVIAVVGIGIKKTFEAISENQAARHAENNAEYLRIRSGNSTTNGSR